MRGFQHMIVALVVALRTAPMVEAWSLPSLRVSPPALQLSSPTTTKSASRFPLTAFSRHPKRLFLSKQLSSSEEEQAEISPLVMAASKKMKRLSWFSWWAQTILTTVSTTILVFAASVVHSGAKNQNAAAAPAFFLSGTALILSAASIIWTWGNGARLSKRLLRPTVLPVAKQHIQAATLIRRALQVQISLNMLGLLGTLLAAEEIVGSLAIKVLTTFGVGAASMYNAPLMGLQPLDILVVQANTNTMLAQAISLTTSLLLTDQIRNLDPPSTLENPRASR